MLSAFDYDDTVDGGAGERQRSTGGCGNDTITGGPGRDTINGDTNSVCTSIVCLPGASNDVIHARDGEVDQIACGFGNDIVVADSIDVVSGDCEAVDRGGAPSRAAAPAAAAGGGSASPVTLPKRLSLTALRTRGLKFKVACGGPCSISATLTASSSLSAQARSLKAPRIVARGTARAAKAGTVHGRRSRPASACDPSSRALRTADFTLKTKVTPKGAKAVTFTQTMRLR